MFVKLLCIASVLTLSSARIIVNNGNTHTFSSSQSTSTIGVINGECRIQDGIIYDGDSQRRMTTTEQAELAAYFEQLQHWQYSSTMSFMDRMRKSMQSMFDMQSNFFGKMFSGEMSFGSESTPFFQMEPIPMMEMNLMPSPPCLCRSVQCSQPMTREFVHPSRPKVHPHHVDPVQSVQPTETVQAANQARPRRVRSVIYRQTASTSSASSSNYPNRPKVSRSSKTVRYGPIIRSGSFSKRRQSIRYIRLPSSNKRFEPTVFLYTSSSSNPSQGLPIQYTITQPNTLLYSDPLTGGLHQHQTMSGPGFSSTSHTYSYGNGGGLTDPVAMGEMSRTQSLLNQMQNEMDEPLMF